MEINKTIFREYDIRGVVGEKLSNEEIKKYEDYYGKFPGITLTNELAVEIGKAYGTIIRKDGGKDIVIGHEMRPFGDELKKAFIVGVRSTGCNVCDTGPATSPLIYFANAYGTFDGGVNVAGSHNLYFYNGFKLMKRDNAPIFGEELQELRKIIESKDYFADTEGKYSKVDFAVPYKEYFTEYVSVKNKLKVVVDSGNGTAGKFAPDILRAIGLDVIELFSKPDATFPNHVPDPEQPQNLEALSKKVREEEADCGVAFDADGDRVGFVDEKGVHIPSDLILILFAKDILSRNHEKKILFDVKSSALVERYVEDYEGIPVMSRTGHSPILQEMHNDPDIIFGGESSGHFYFTENYFRIDDGLWAAAKFLELFSQQNVPFSALFKQFPTLVRTPELKLLCADEKKFIVVDKIQKILSKKYPSITLDGIRIKVTETGWGIIRASNTSPYLTIRVEGDSDEEVIKVKNILADELEKHPEIVDKLNRNKVASLTGKLGWV